LGKVILVLCDALRYDTAVAGMGFLGHLVEIKQASLYKVMGELPSISRPTYETTHTGVPAIEHGIVSNSIVRRSNQPNLFGLSMQAGKTTAAAAYYWFSELYNGTPFNPIDDREVDDITKPIQHGRFYTEDDYPDRELFHTAAMLRRRFSPDYLLIHPMGLDTIGETYGADTRQYRTHATSLDAWLAPLIVEWMENGYHILVTGDHGINSDRDHGGTTAEVREVPLYKISPDRNGRGNTGEVISQLQIAPTICRLLGLAIPETMRYPPVQ
jgi:predicted AlkP superfamily pyrophosphatase or phosphodiesterase